METRHPVEGQFGNEFPAICDHCGVMTASRKMARSENFVSKFLKKRPCTVKFSISKVSTASPIDVVFICGKIYLMENRRNRALFTWQKTKNSAASQTVATARIARKICQGQTPTMCSRCSRFHPNPCTFGGAIAKRVNIVFCPVECFHSSPE